MSSLPRLFRSRQRSCHRFDFEPTARGPRARWVDRLGATAGTLCAFHCVLALIVPGLLLSAEGTATFEGLTAWGLTLATLLLGVLAAWRCAQEPRTSGQIWLFLALLGGLVLARAFESIELSYVGEPLAILSGLGLALVHLHRCRNPLRITLSSQRTRRNVAHSSALVTSLIDPAKPTKPSTSPSYRLPPHASRVATVVIRK